MFKTWLHAAAIATASFLSLPDYMFVEEAVDDTTHRQPATAYPANDDQPFLRAAD